MQIFLKLILGLIQTLSLTLLLMLARLLGYLGWFLDRHHRRVALRNVEIALSHDAPVDSGGNRPRSTSSATELDEIARGGSPGYRGSDSPSDRDTPSFSPLPRGRARGGPAQFVMVSDNLEMHTIARESFVRLVTNTFETIWIAEQSDAEVQHLFHITGAEEYLLPVLAKKQGVILVMFHLGNWEILSRIVSRIPEVKFSTIYQPLKNRYFDRIVSEWRSSSGVGLINRHHGFSEAATRLRRGEVVGMFVDQHAGDHGMWLPFFERLASTTPLPAILARRTGAAIIPIFCHEALSISPKVSEPHLSSPCQGEVGRGLSSGKGLKSAVTSPLASALRWRIEFGSPIATKERTDAEIMADTHARLEEVIHHDPANWFWLHDRWKTPSPDFLLRHYRRGVHVPRGSKLKPFRVLVRGTNWLGDSVLTIPALRAIKAGRPDCHLTILTPPKLVDLWKDQSYVDEVVTSISEARRQRFDAAILFPNSLRSALEVWTLGIPRRQGYTGHSRSWLLTAICPGSLRGGPYEHDVKDFCGLARWCGAEVESEIPRLELPVPASNSEFRIQNSEFIVLHPGAAFGSAKRWLPDRFLELARRFPDIRWCIIGGEEERERNAELSRKIANGVQDLTGRLNLAELGQLLARAKVVVCNDSGPMHLAAAVGARVVAIFGSTEPLRTGPLGEGHQVLRRQVVCSPCYLRQCPIDLRCMKAVTVDDVAQALR